jgi:hypothetical protein
MRAGRKPPNSPSRSICDGFGDDSSTDLRRVAVDALDVEVGTTLALAGDRVERPGPR